jgi:ferredoxin
VRAYVDPDRCVGCGLCCATAPEVFRMNGGCAEAYAAVSPAAAADVDEAVDSCPVAAIRVEE